MLVWRTNGHYFEHKENILFVSLNPNEKNTCTHWPGLAVLYIASVSTLACVCSGTPVIRLEMMRGRMSIFSILMRISPGKETMVRAELSVTAMYRSSIPNATPITTPEERWGECVFWKEIMLIFQVGIDDIINILQNCMLIDPPFLSFSWTHWPTFLPPVLHLTCKTSD